MADARAEPRGREAYRWFLPITTRWGDNDAYGHVNNVVYYAWFDTAVNRFLIDNRLLDPVSSPEIGVVAETGCRYFESVSYPDEIEAGLALERLGQRSVAYRIGIFRKGAVKPAAEGRFVHVYVGRLDRRPVAVPDPVRAVLERLLA